MSHKIRILNDTYIRELLTHIPQPPKSLYIRGILPPSGHKLITIVGSRKCSEYSKQVIEEICTALQNQPVSIISGLALGIDSYVHTQALQNNIHTIAVVGSGLSEKVLYPRTNIKLSKLILNSGGALVSEYEPDLRSQVWMFPARNRIMVGLSSLVIIIEAREKSGTLITARLATDYNRDLLVVPNSIYSSYSKGSNELIKQGAYIYTKPSDIFQLLNLEIPETQTLFSQEFSSQEKIIIQTIQSGQTQMEEIIKSCHPELSIPEIIQTTLSLEIKNTIKKIDGVYTLTN